MRSNFNLDYFKGYALYDYYIFIVSVYPQNALIQLAIHTHTHTFAQHINTI